MRILFWMGIALLTACGARDVSVTDEGSSVQRIEGTPNPLATLPSRNPVSVSAAPAMLSVLSGSVAVGTSSGLLAESKTVPDSVVPVEVVSSGTEPPTTGSLFFVSRRSSGGIVVSAQNGIFADASGYLLPSPITQSLAGLQVRTIDAFGLGASEEIWLTTDSGVYHVGGGELTQVTLHGVRAQPDAALATNVNLGIVTAGGTGYLVDLTKMQATVFASGFGSVNGFDRAEDGKVFLATSAGLLSRTRQGAVTLFSFAPASQPGVNVLSVASAYGSVLAATAASLIRVNAADSSLLGSLGGAAGKSVAVDAVGDTWALDQGNLFHYLTGKPVSYATDVKPFFDLHCVKCHGTGANGAPVINFDDYATAVQFAPLIVNRLQGLNVSPMPPPSSEVLTSADYAVVIRWFSGGMQP